MSDGNSIKTKVKEILQNYTGETTARMYEDFYRDKDDELVLVSTQALLEEYVGVAEAKEILIKYNLIKE